MCKLEQLSCQESLLQHCWFFQGIGLFEATFPLAIDFLHEQAGDVSLPGQLLNPLLIDGIDRSELNVGEFPHDNE